MTTKKIYEDFLDDTPNEDIIQHVKASGDMDRFPMTIFIYGSPMTSTKLDDVKKIAKRLKVLSERTTGLYDEIFEGPVAFGDAQTFDVIPLVSGDEAIRYHFPGNAYYAFEIGCIPKFTSPVKLINFINDVYHLLEPLNNKQMNFVFRQDGDEDVLEFRELKTLDAIQNNPKKPDDFSIRLAWRSLNKICSHLFKNIIDAYNKTTEFIGVNPGKLMEDSNISSFKSQRARGSYAKSKMVAVKAGPKNAIMNREINGNMLDFPASCYINVHEAIPDTNIGDFQCVPHNAVSKDIISELNQMPRKFQRVRWQTFGDNTVMFIGYLGLFWLESRQTLATVSLCAYTDFYDNTGNNKLFKFCENMINLYGDREQKNIYRLYNDIVKASN